MKLLSAIVISLSLFGSAGAHTQAQETASDDAAPRSPLQAAQIKITPSGSQQSSKGPTEHFAGSVHIEQLFNVHAPSRSVGASVTFEPGARTAWHVGADHFQVDARIEGNRSDFAFVRDRGIGNGDRNLAVREPRQNGQGEQDDSEKQPEQKSKHGRSDSEAHASSGTPSPLRSHFEPATASMRSHSVW